MRDKSGYGNIYFDDLFVNGTIPWISVLFYSTNALISIFNLILTPILFYSIFINWNFHKNLKITFSNLYVAFFLVAFGNIVYSLLVLTRVSDKRYDNIFTVFRFGASIGPGIWRSTFIAIILERAAATIFYKTYENKAPLWLAFVLFIFAQTGILVPIMFFLVRLPYFVNTAIIAVIDISIALIIENLRAIKLMAPLLILGIIFDFVANSTAALESLIDYNTQLLYPSYLFVTNLYVMVALFLSLRKDSKIRNMLAKVCGFLGKKNPTVIPERLDSTIRNVDGEVLIVIDTPEAHFKQLQVLWKK